MNILLLGANGMLGPYVIKALENEHKLRLTDINDPPDTNHEYIKLDVLDLDGVIAAAKGMDAIVNLSVLRPHRIVAFDVNAVGCYNAMRAAVEHKINKVINTGPHFTIAGPTYEDFDFNINPEIPSQSGTGLYAHTKSLGQEICRVFSENQKKCRREGCFSCLKPSLKCQTTHPWERDLSSVQFGLFQLRHRTDTILKKYSVDKIHFTSFFKEKTPVTTFLFISQ